MKNEIKTVNSDLKDDIADLKQTLNNGDDDLDGKIQTVKSNLTVDIQTVQSDLKNEIKTVKSDLEVDIADLEQALNNGDNTLDGKISEIERVQNTVVAFRAKCAKNFPDGHTTYKTENPGKTFLNHFLKIMSRR